MSKWPRRGHFRYLRFKTFSMKPRTPQCEVFWALLSSSKHSGVPEDSKSPTLEVLGFTPTLGQSGVATFPPVPGYGESCESMFVCGSSMHQMWSNYTLTNLLFNLCRSVWVIDLLVILPSPYLKALTRPSTPKVMRIREHAPTPYSSFVFTLWIHGWVH